MKAKPVSLPFALLLLFGHAYAAMPDIPPSLLKEAQQGDASAQNKIGDSYLRRRSINKRSFGIRKPLNKALLQRKSTLPICTTMETAFQKTTSKPWFGIEKQPSKVMQWHNLILQSNTMRAKAYR